MTLEQRIAWQRAQVEKLKAVKPAPVKRDPPRRKRRRMSMQEYIDSFIEDRVYDEARKVKDADNKPIAVISKDSVKSMSDIFAILTREQPDEYVHSSRKPTSGKSLMHMGMDDIELTEQSGSDSPEVTRDMIMDSGEELRTETVANVSVKRTVPTESAIPTPTGIRPFAPPPRKAAANVDVRPNVSTAQMQNRMMDAIRAQRRQAIDTMDE